MTDRLESAGGASMTRLVDFKLSVLASHGEYVTGPDTQGPRTTDSSLITKSNFRSELRSQSRIQ
jgi:hypothetical protein